MSKECNPNPDDTWFQDWERNFSTLEDPRVGGRTLHPLMEVIMLSLLAILAGAEAWTEIEVFGKLKQHWLTKFLAFPYGIPSHDTIGRIFSILDAEQFQSCFTEWAKNFNKLPEDLISMDGKALRGSNNFGESPATIVSAWSATNNIVLGQIKTDKKSNEITSLPKLIDQIDVSGSIVSIDAAGCQKNIAEKIIENKADYLLALKGNQSTLRNEVESFLSSIQDAKVSGKNIDRYEQAEKSHGRLEKRICVVSTDTHLLPVTREWKNLNTVVMIESTRCVHNESKTERRFYISSAERSALDFFKLTRGHWGIENKLHWVLDVTFREDQCRVRSGKAAENFATLRHIALNLIKKDMNTKGSNRANNWLRVSRRDFYVLT